MEQQRSRARMGIADAHGSEDRHGKVISFASSAPPTRFVGYETAARDHRGQRRRAPRTAGRWSSSRRAPSTPRAAARSPTPACCAGTGARPESPTSTGSARTRRSRSSFGRESFAPGIRVEAQVEPELRHATMRNHTATHLLHAALRERLGTHVRQAGSAVRPDKLRFDFTHGHALSSEELREIEDLVNEWVKASRPVRWMIMERAEAERLGAMALFGEKYGDWVRVVEVEDVSRELCGGTHVANTAEVGIFTITAEGSSAANVRRIEALTGPAAIDWFRERVAELRQTGELLGSPQDPVAAARRAAERLEQLSKGAQEAERDALADAAKRLAESSEEVDGVRLVAGEAPIADQKQLLEMADRVRQSLGEAAVVLGGAADGRVGIVACFAPGVVERGLSAAEVVREAAALVGGGGGGRDEVAQAGGKDPEKLSEALAVARQAIERKLAG